jgi:hypothetical protein
VLEETGIVPVSYATLRRRLPAFAKEPGGGSCLRPARRMPG